MNQSSTNQDGTRPARAEPVQLPALFEQFRSRLRTLVEMRLDRRIRARVDASDVLQEAYADAVRRYPEYEQEQERKLPPYIWLRFLTMQQLVLAHRRHLGVHARTALLEQPIHLFDEAGVDSGTIAICLAGSESTPSAKVSRAEEIERMKEALDHLEPLDREVLALRHFEQLEHSEIGEILNMTSAAVSSRYRRALKRIGLAINSQHGSS
jgi:RNA polymerase sigma-70 factor, ECF subfamily